jgi:hypothetical protein
MPVSDAQIRAAAHLVAAELRNAREAATFILQREPFTHFPVDAWQQCRLLLADTLTFDDWQDVAVAYRRIHAYNWRVSAHAFEGSPDKERICHEIVERAARAESRLARLQETNSEVSG